MRQKMSQRNVEKYKRITGLPIDYILVRGNTEHRKDLHLEDRSVKCLFPDGIIYNPDGTIYKQI